MPLRLLSIAVLVLAGCARADYGEARSGRLSMTGGPQPGYAMKRVGGKDAPATLVADDGSVCRTSSHRFAATAEGAWIACDWTLPT
ncbi:MAG: hypothetical protein ACJ8BF_11790 [Gemmatimonadales bacterium]